MGGGPSKCPDCPPCANNTSSTPSSTPPPPKIIESGNFCPNGKVIGQDESGTKSCVPLTCMTGTTLKADSKGTFGCTLPNKPDDPPLICPYGTRSAFETCFPATMPFDFPVTDNNNFCPKGYDTIFNGNNMKCQISSDPNAGIGNIIKTCVWPIQGGPSAPPGSNTIVMSGGLGGTTGSTGSACPGNSNMAANDQCQLGCAVGSGPVKICGTGTKYVLDANNTLQCEPVTTNTPARFTNVYDFKSKRDRNVENFSQNNNNKCKARY
jgi:hypothetical protein